MAEIHTTASLTPGKLELLPTWMAQQRWYAAKGRAPRLRRLGAWRLGDPAGEVGIETLILLDESDPAGVVYQVPLTYRAAPLAGAEHALVGTLQHSVLGKRWVYDGPHDPVYAAQLLELTQGRVTAESSRASDTPEPGVFGLAHPMWTTQVSVTGSRVLSGEQSNTSVIYDAVRADGSPEPLICKIFRTLSPGENPDVVVQGALAEAGSTAVPLPVGSVTGEWEDRDGQPVRGHLAFAQEFYPGTEDAWRVALRAVAEGTDFTPAARGLGEATA